MNITPPHLRCGLGQCPSVHYLKDGDYTPEHLKCAVSMACPGVRGHNGKLVIVGRKADDIATELGLGVGPDEAVIAIGEEYFSDLPELVRLREENESLREALGCQAEVTAVGERSSNTACSLQTGVSAEAIRHLKLIRDDVFHEEQLQIWSDEFLADISPYVNVETYDDGVVLHESVKAFLTSRVLERIGEALLEAQRPDEERASAMSAHSESHHSPDTEDETPGGSQNPVSEPLP